VADQPIRLLGDPVLPTPAAPVVDADTRLRTALPDWSATRALPRLTVGPHPTYGRAL
jgi:hypothetical protein